MTAAPALAPHGPVGIVLAALQAAGCKVKKSGHGYTAKCPAHEDGRASLSVTEGRDGRVLVHCFAGCEVAAIVAALGLSAGDLFSAPSDSRAGPALARHIVATYDYRDEHDDLLYQVVRYEPKDFRQRRPDGAGGYSWKLSGVRRVLYRLPTVIEAAALGQTIYLVEGEKDANALVALGLCATTNAGGAGKWSPDFTTTLAGAAVVLLPDNDDPGRDHARRVANELVAAGCVVRIVELPGLAPKGDVSDWIDAGGTAAMLAQHVALARVEDLPVATVEGLDRAADDELTPGITPPPALDPAAFAGPFGAYVREIAPGTEASPAAVLIALLIGFGTMVGRGPHQFLGSTRHQANLFGLLVGATGRGRKTTALSDARTLLERVAPDFWAKHSPRVLGGFGSGEAVIARLAPAAGAPAIPDPRLFIFESEFGGVMAVKRREGNLLGITLRNAWDGEPLANQTKNDARVVGEHHVGLLGAITPEELHDTLSAIDQANGFANRFLFVHTQQAQVLPHAGRPAEQLLADYGTVLGAAYERARFDREVPLTPSGAAWWGHWYGEWAAHPPEDTSTARLTQRTPAQLRRLALIFALAGARDAVDVVDLEAAAAIVRYSEATIARLFPPTNPLSDLARKICDALTIAGAPGLSRTAIRDDVVRSNSVPKEKITEALQALHGRSLAVVAREPSANGGRPREVWRLSRHAVPPSHTDRSERSDGT